MQMSCIRRNQSSQEADASWNGLLMDVRLVYLYCLVASSQKALNSGA